VIDARTDLLKRRGVVCIRPRACKKVSSHKADHARESRNEVRYAQRREQPAQPLHWPQSSSASRFTAGAFGFLLLIQCGERPERYCESLRFDTMPSRPILQACAKLERAVLLVEVCIIIHHCGWDESRPVDTPRLPAAVDAQLSLVRDEDRATLTLQYMRDGVEGTQVLLMKKTVIIGEDDNGKEKTSQPRGEA
jgi:hypothetical protein